MNFLVVGPGAMGTLFAVKLHRAGYRVTLLDYKAERAETIQKEGGCVEGAAGVQDTAHLPVVTTPVAPPVDVVLICVKATQTKTAARSIAQWLPSEATILTLQNGLGNLKVLRETLGEHRVLGGVTSEGATLIGPGHAKHAGKGETFIGPAKTDPGRKNPIHAIVEAFNNAGFHTEATDEVEDLIWGKLIVNVGINALTAITGLKNGRLPQIEATRTIMEGAVKEAVRVAEAKGVRLPYAAPLDRVLAVCRSTADNVASMLQDTLAKRPTEVDFINGAIVREGNKAGIPTPVNLLLTCLVKTLQETYDERLAG